MNEEYMEIIEDPMNYNDIRLCGTTITETTDSIDGQ